MVLDVLPWPMPLALDITGMKQIIPENIKEYLANTPQITFEITERCNLSCVYCGYGKLYSDRDARYDRMLDTQNAIAFLKYIKSLWDSGYQGAEANILHISFYGGEPLMNMPFIKEVVAYIEKELLAYKKIVFSMTTNALLLPQNLDYLVSKGFRILISLDGDRIGNTYRVFPNGQPAYDYIVKSIDYARNTYPDFFRDNISFNAVLNNCNSVKSIRDFFMVKYGKTPSIGEINIAGVKEEERELFEKLHKSKVDSEEEAALESRPTCFQDSPEYMRSARYIQTHSPYTYHDYNELLFGRGKSNRMPTGTCLPFAKKVFITVSWKILPCESIGHKYALGRIEDGQILLDFKEIADKYNAYYERVNRVCQKCHDYLSCLCCMFYNGQLENEKSVCSFFVNKQMARVNQNSAYSFLRKYPEAYSYIMNKLKIV